MFAEPRSDKAGAGKLPDSVVPPQIIAELTQILSHLALGDNEIRAK